MESPVKNISALLKSLQDKVKKTANLELMDRCDTLFQEYRYMLSFVANGGNDENRAQYIRSLRQRIDDLSADVERVNLFHSIPGHEVIFAQTKDIDKNSTSLIDALNNKNLSPEEHFTALNNAFSAILFSIGWHQREQRLWTAFLISSDTNPVDAQTLVAAIMLSCRIKFCMEKFRTLAYVYLTSDNEAVRQRALVGWCVNIENLEDKELAEELFGAEETRREVLKLMMQMVASSNANKDGERIKQEIMPELLKHQVKSGILSDDIIKSNEDTLSDILNPGREEQEMEKVEKSIAKMSNMLKEGSDIFFGEFSKLKRYPFFYKPVNWFMPFVYEHPLLTDARKKLDSVKSLEHIYRNGPFCDSDRYSFTFSLASVYSLLPQKVQEMLSNGEVGPLGTLPQGSEREITPDYLRRMYIQDLYRFYNLSPQLKLKTIFSDDFFVIPFTFPGMNKYLIDYGKFLMRHGYTHLMKDVELRYNSLGEDKKEGEYALLLATYYKSQGKDTQAYNFYRKASRLLPENESALRGFARYSLIVKNYEEAMQLYDALCEKHPDSLPLAQNRVLAYTYGGKATEMVNEIYRLDIEHDNNLSTKRLLAWVLFCNKRKEQAEDLYLSILAGDYGAPSMEDFLSYAELLWFMGKPKEAIEIVSKQLRDDDGSEKAMSCYESLKNDFELLGKYYSVPLEDASLIVDAAVLL